VSPLDPPRRSIQLTDPRALRAVAHPTRLELVGLLRREGPLTATRAGELLGQSAASCSFHLRQLAKYGLVEEAGGGRGRERPWRATASFTSWPNVAGDPELAAAADLLSAVVVERLFERVMQWLDAKRSDPPEWQQAAEFGDSMLHLSSVELADLGSELQALLDSYAGRPASPDRRRAAAIYFAFPFPEEREGGR
jgi:DNA-binding transcriptional ArsR family regulator